MVIEASGVTYPVLCVSPIKCQTRLRFGICRRVCIGSSRRARRSRVCRSRTIYCVKRGGGRSDRRWKKCSDGWPAARPSVCAPRLPLLSVLRGRSANPLHRYPHFVLLPRIWQLRNNFTAYDAAHPFLKSPLRRPITPDGGASAGSLGGGVGAAGLGGGVGVGVGWGGSRTAASSGDGGGAVLG